MFLESANYENICYGIKIGTDKELMARIEAASRSISQVSQRFPPYFVSQSIS